MPESSQSERADTAFLNIYAAPERGVRVLAAADPNAFALSDKLGEVARRTLSLRRLIEIKNKYDTILRRVFVYVSGLSSICAMHATYNQMAGNLAPGEEQALVDAANKLLDMLSKHPAYLNIAGILCDVDSRKVTQISLGTQFRDEVNGLTNLLLSDDLKEPYKAWSATMSMGPFTGRELHNSTFVEGVANRILADAIATLSKADPNNDVVTAAVALVERADSELESPSESAKTIVEFTFQARARLSLALSSNLGGLGIGLLGKDGLLLRLVQTYCTTKFSEAIASAPAADALKKFAIGKLSKAVGLEREPMLEKFDKLVAEAREAAIESNKLTSAIRALPPGAHLEDLKLKRIDCDAKAERMRVEFREDVSKKIGASDHPLDNGIANIAITIFAGIQAWDACLTFSTDTDASQIGKIKAYVDESAAAVSAAASAATAYARIKRIELVDNKSLTWIYNFSDKFVPAATILSGALQAVSGFEEHNNVDISAGLLNVASGAFSGWCRERIMEAVASEAAGWLPVEAIPIIGPACAIASFGMVATDIAQQLVESNVGRYVKGTIDEIKKSRWGEEERPAIEEQLGIKSAVEILESIVKDTRFQAIPVVPGVSRDDLLRTLTFYTGSDSAELLIYDPPGSPGHK